MAKPEYGISKTLKEYFDKSLSPLFDKKTMGKIKKMAAVFKAALEAQDDTDR